MGAIHELYPQPSRGNHQGRTDLLLRGRDFVKKFMPIIYVIAFVIGIIFIVTADTGLITSYYPALIAGVIISCFAGVFLAIYLYAWHKQSK